MQVTAGEMSLHPLAEDSNIYNSMATLVAENDKSLEMRPETQLFNSPSIDNKMNAKVAQLINAKTRQ